MAAEEALSSVSTSLQNIEENLERFLSFDKKHSASILSVLRDVFNYSKKDEAVCGRKIQACPFENLQLDPINFDNEIIWQQIELQNESLLPKVRSGLKLLSRDANSVQLSEMTSTSTQNKPIASDDGGKRLDFVQGTSESSSNEGSEVEDHVEENNNDNGESPAVAKGKLKSKGLRVNQKGSIVDDQFFKLAEMEKFLETKYSKGDGSEDESVDYFADLNEVEDDVPDIERYLIDGGLL